MSLDSLRLPRAAGVVIAAAGWLTLLATYWDDAWHTDVGRDSALTPPHVALYGSVAAAGLAVAWWGAASLARARSLAPLRWPPLLLAAAGGTAVLAAAPIDAAWHAAYGRDAVLWSPPHMLAVFGSVAMLTGVLAALAPARPRVLEAALSGLLLGTLAVSVMEYDTDVPQFSEVFYLPALLAAGLLAVAVVRALVPRRYAVTAMAAAYVAFRLAAIPALAALGRSTPALPVAVCGLAAYPDRAATVTAERLVYRPAQATPGSARRTQTAAGAAIYAAGLALLGSALAVARRRAAPASEPARQAAGPG